MYFYSSDLHCIISSSQNNPLERGLFLLQWLYAVTMFGGTFLFIYDRPARKSNLITTHIICSQSLHFSARFRRDSPVGSVCPECDLRRRFCWHMSCLSGPATASHLSSLWVCVSPAIETLKSMQILRFVIQPLDSSKMWKSQPMTTDWTRVMKTKVSPRTPHESIKCLYIYVFISMQQSSIRSPSVCPFTCLLLVSAALMSTFVIGGSEVMLVMPRGVIWNIL